ncbi:MAG: cysteine--tRNA ligase [Streptobacillus sp.]
MKIYNSLTNSLENFNSIEKNKVGIYVCGPTVYNYIHIGNSRPIIVFDVLARYLKSIGYEVKFVQNFTDIDDKIIKKSIEEKVPFKDITEKYISAFLEDISKLNIIEGILRPRVSENIPEIIQMIENLINNSYAYVLNGDVLFDVHKYRDYGKLSNRTISNKENVEETETKKNVEDFALWKKKKEGEPYWDSPWSKGRPGWHIECSAMSEKYLGKNFDIHCGGLDLIFPHHENEIAQSICSHCEKTTFANYWMHNGFVEINGEKMSKSLGNFITLHDILKEYEGNILRFFMLTSHYRKPINFSYENIEIAKKTLSSIEDTLYRYESISNIQNSNKEILKLIDKFNDKFKEALDEDLNTPAAISSIHDHIKDINKLILNNGYIELKNVVDNLRDKLVNILGVELNMVKNNKIEEQLIDLLYRIREDARSNKNYELSDFIRDELFKIGIKTSDRKVKNEN